MMVDDTPPLQPGNEAFKRKLIDRGKDVSGERKARLLSEDAETSMASESMEAAMAAPPGAISIICLNCRGLGDPEAVNKLRNFIQRQSPGLVFLSETKRSASEMENVKKKIKGYERSPLTLEDDLEE